MKIGSVSGNTAQDFPAQRASDGAVPAKAATTPVRVETKAEQKAELKSEGIKDVEEQGVRSEFSDELMKKSVDQANKALIQHNRFIEREVHEQTHTVMYKIKDTVTNEVIAEYPPKKIQDMIAKMWELAGLFVDERA